MGVLDDWDYPSTPPAPPPIREVREGYAPEVLTRLGWFISGAAIGSFVWAALS